MNYVLISSAESNKVAFAKEMERIYGFDYVSVGVLICQTCAYANYLPETISDEERIAYKDLKDIVSYNQEIPSKLLAWIIDKKLSETPNRNHIIDGFPRSEEDVIEMESMDANFKGAIYLFQPDKIIKEKLQKSALINKRKEYTDEYITTHIHFFHEIFDPVICKFRLLGELIQISVGEEIGEMAKKCYQMIQMVCNDSDDESESI